MSSGISIGERLMGYAVTNAPLPTAKDIQIGGDHYKKMGIQPTEYIAANNLNFFEGNVVKYVTRHRSKKGKEDLEKAIHYLQLLIEYEYTKENSEKTVQPVLYKTVVNSGVRFEPGVLQLASVNGCPACDEVK